MGKELSEVANSDRGRATYREGYQHAADPSGQQNIQKGAPSQKQGAVRIIALRPEGVAVGISKIRSPAPGYLDKLKGKLYYEY